MAKINKTYIFVIFITLISLAFINEKEPIEGYWFDDSREGKIEIYKATNGKFYGKLVWLKVPVKNGKPKLDEKNKDEKLRSQPLIGLNLLQGFSKDDAIYSGGTIYDPKSGKTYSCKITPKDINTLSIRGYVGISLLGRTTIWTRATP